MVEHTTLAVNRELHHRMRILAAEQSISMKALTERLLRLGMVAPELARLIEHIGFCWDAEQNLMCPWCEGCWGAYQPIGMRHDADCPAQAALAAYEAALNGKETE